MILGAKPETIALIDVTLGNPFYDMPKRHYLPVCMSGQWYSSQKFQVYFLHLIPFWDANAVRQYNNAMLECKSLKMFQNLLKL